MKKITFNNGRYLLLGVVATFLFLIAPISFAQASTGNFITTWKTDNPGVSSPTSITIPAAGPTSYDVDWDNDGVFDQFGVVGPVTHDFGVAGTYTIRIQGLFSRIRFNNGGDKEKIIAVEEWGNNAWTSMASAFYGCSNLVINATDAPNFSGATNLSRMFRGASSVTGNVSHWDLSNVTNTNSMFRGATAFNDDLSAWDLSAMLSIGQMFRGASAFNGDVTTWSTNTITNMNNVFRNATSFNQDIGNWDTGSVASMNNMFLNATSFDQDISSWDIANVASMNTIFSGAKLSTENYDNLLISWDDKIAQPNINFDGGNSTYCNGETARDSLITNDLWSIVDAGKLCTPQPAMSHQLIPRRHRVRRSFIVQKLNKQDTLGEQCPFSEYLRLGDRDGEKKVTQVEKLQDYLNQEGFLGLIYEKGYFDNQTFEAVKNLQLRYAEDILTPWRSAPTGYVFKTTRKKLNELAGCDEGSISLGNGIILY